MLAHSLGVDDRARVMAALGRVAADPELAATLRRHQLTAMLWATVPEAELRSLMPAEAFSRCRDTIRRSWPSAEENLRVLAEAQQALADDGIECMLLKGAYFAHRLYGGLERRPQYDVDLLVRRRELVRAGRRLAALGFVERWRDLHSVTWERARSQIDLHGCFRNVPVYRLDEERIWRDRSSYAIADVAFTTPSDEDTLVLLALSLFQDLGLAAAKLKQLVDVYLLAASIDERFDWPGFLARRRPEGTLPIVVNVLDLACRLFDTAPTRLAAALAPLGDVIVVTDSEQAHALLAAARGAAANKAWFFRVYPGSLTRYWLWLLPRKLPAYLRGNAPARGASSMRPSLATLRLAIAARRDLPPDH